MSRPLVYADFQNLDDEHRLRLTAAGTRRDLARQGIELSEGLGLTLYTDDEDDDGRPLRMLADAIVHRDAGAEGWVAAIDWSAIRHEPSPEGLPA